MTMLQSLARILVTIARHPHTQRVAQHVVKVAAQELIREIRRRNNPNRRTPAF